VLDYDSTYPSKPKDKPRKLAIVSYWAGAGVAKQRLSTCQPSILTTEATTDDIDPTDTTIEMIANLDTSRLKRHTSGARLHWHRNLRMLFDRLN
jgi:hypothetical protein